MSDPQPPPVDHLLTHGTFLRALVRELLRDDMDRRHRGRRREWRLALVPLLGRWPPGGEGAAPGAGPGPVEARARWRWTRRRSRTVAAAIVLAVAVAVVSALAAFRSWGAAERTTAAVDAAGSPRERLARRRGAAPPESDTATADDIAAEARRRAASDVAAADDNEIVVEVRSAVDGAPIEGATVETSYSTGRWRNLVFGGTEVTTATTGADGIARVARQGRANGLRVRKRGFVAGKVHLQERATESFRLVPGTVVEGRVTSASGAPLAGATVRVAGPGGMDELLDRFVDVDSESRYDTTVPSDQPFSITAVCPGFGHVTSFEFPSPPSMRVDLVLGRGATVRGVVRGPACAPLGGAEVRLVEVGPTALDRYARATAHRGWWERNTDVDDPLVHTVSGPDGAYELVGVAAPADWTPIVTGRGRMAQTFDAISVDDAGSVVERDLALVDRVVLEVRLLDAEGEPVTRGRVGVSEADDRFRAQADTDDAGAVSLALPRPGDYVVSAVGDRGAPLRVAVAVPAEPLEVRLPRGESIAGVVVDPAGRPIPQALVQTDLFSPELGMQFYAGALTQADGRFVLDGLVPGRLRFHAVVIGRTDEWFHANSGDRDVRVVLRRPGRLVGRVAPVPRTARMVWRNDGGSDRSVALAADGGFVIEDPTTTLLLECGEFAPVLLEDVRVAPEEPTDIGTVRMAPGAALAGVVRDERGVPVAGARVELVLSAPTRAEPLWWRREAFTDARGGYRFAGVSPLHLVELELSKAGFVRSSRSLGGMDPGSASFDVMLVRCGEVVGRVTPTPRRSGARVTFDVLERAPLTTQASEPREPPYAQVDASGIFREWVAPGRYRATLSFEGHALAVSEVEVVAERITRLDLRLR